MQDSQRYFYKFTGLHSILIGLLPFFLPVMLVQKGATLSQLALFVGLTGLGFIFTLFIWDKIRQQGHWRVLIIGSFILELMLVLAIVLLQGIKDQYVWLALLALLNGAYNCFYWSTQRLMFSGMTTSKNSGDKFGNFQILVVILLKIGLLMGALLIESKGQMAIFALSSCLTVVAILIFIKASPPSAVQPLLLKQSVSISEIFNFRDKNSSMLIFIVDGVFLYLESYFWVVSLFYVTEQNVFQLGILIVSLTLVLALLFYVIKSRIDSFNVHRVYLLACVLYALSWLLRGQINTEISTVWLYITITLIGFLTTFFRLAFNKRFFDVASLEATHQYILCKSYYSQAALAVFFITLSFFLIDGQENQVILQNLYWLASPMALMYLAYRYAMPKQLTRQENWG
ncbi:MAG: MFS transporter [Bermanella sp.]